MALIHQKGIILEHFEDRKITCEIFVDLSKAFHFLNHETLSSKLDHYGVRGQSLDFIRSYLKHRKQSVVIDGHLSDESCLKSGGTSGYHVRRYLVYGPDYLTTHGFVKRKTCSFAIYGLSDRRLMSARHSDMCLFICCFFVCMSPLHSLSVRYLS